MIKKMAYITGTTVGTAVTLIAGYFGTKFFVRHKLKTSRHNLYRYRPLQKEANNPENKRLSWLLVKSSQWTNTLETPQDKGITPLYLAIQNNNTQAVEQLIDAGADLTKGSLLTEAALKGNLTIVQKLLNAGAPVDQKDSCGRTPLHEAAYAQHPKIISELIKAGALKNIEDGQAAFKAALSSYRNSSCHVSSLEADKIKLDTLEQLIEGNPNIVCQENQQAMAVAIYHPNTNLGVVELLLKHSDWDTLYKALQTLVDAGSTVNRLAVIKKHCEDNKLNFVNLINYDDGGSSLLEKAVSNSNFSLANALLDEGADPNQGLHKPIDTVRDHIKTKQITHPESQWMKLQQRLLFQKGSKLPTTTQSANAQEKAEEDRENSDFG